MLCEQLYEKCEEFFDLLPETDRTDEVEEIIDHVTQFLINEIDGHTSREACVLAEEVEMQIRELWSLLPAEEKKTNNNLCDYFEDILETTSRVLDRPYSVDDEDLEDEECEYEDDCEFGDEEEE
jgi:hypothetical protein